MMSRLIELTVGVLMILALLPVHECAHALVADRLGDPTARSQGRLTLNPFRHVDPLGAVALLFLHFGWGRPVPVDARYFRNPRRDMALVALAGPVSNLLMALVLVIAWKLLLFVLGLAGLLGSFASMFLYILQSLALTSIYLAVFNLIPVPPLDGSRLLEYLIPGGYYVRVAPYQRVIYGVILLLLFTGILTRPLSMVSRWIFQLIDLLTFPLDLLL